MHNGASRSTLHHRTFVAPVLPQMKGLTDTKVRAIKPTQGRAQYPDPSVPGLVLRVTPAGTKTWVFSYREDGKQRRMVLGRFPAVGLREARELAKRAYSERLVGHDPQEARDARKRLAAESRRNTFAKTVDEFMRIHVERNNKRVYRESIERNLRIHILPVWGDRPVSSITRRNCIDLIEDIAETNGPHTATHVRSLIRKLLGWAAERDIIATNPAQNIARPIRASRRDRILSDSELAAIYHASSATPYPSGPFVRLLVLTAQRRSEVSTMQHAHIEGGVWTIPSESTKASRKHQVYLSKPGRVTINSIRRFDDGPFVFSTQFGRVPISGYSKIKTTIDAASGVTDWRFHDLRRTAATRMNEIGIQPHIVEAILNHAIPGVAGVYNYAQYLPQKKAALERWAEYVEDVAKRYPT